MGKKNSSGRGGSSHKRGRGRGRGTSSKGRFRDLSTTISSPSFEDRPESAVDDVEGVTEESRDEIDISSSDSGTPLALAHFDCLIQINRQGFTDSDRGSRGDVGKYTLLLHLSGERLQIRTSIIVTRVAAQVKSLLALVSSRNSKLGLDFEAS